jgi:hypothetical protein
LAQVELEDLVLKVVLLYSLASQAQVAALAQTMFQQEQSLAVMVVQVVVLVLL